VKRAFPPAQTDTGQPQGGSRRAGAGAVDQHERMARGRGRGMDGLGSADGTQVHAKCCLCEPEGQKEGRQISGILSIRQDDESWIVYDHGEEKEGRILRDDEVSRVGEAEGG